MLTSSHILPRHATIGIMGGGQLGRMLAMAAAARGYRSHIFTPDQHSPASQVAWQTTVAAYDDETALRTFAESVAVVTFEFENVPPAALELLASHTAVHPDPAILKTTRHRLREKEMIQAQDIVTAPFAAVRTLEELHAALAAIGTPAVLKTCELGYDGKGQVKIEASELPSPDERGNELARLWHSLNTSDTILEGWVDFEREISVIVARNAQGQTRCYEPSHNIHRAHILHRTLVPAGISAEIAHNAQTIAGTLVEALNLVGILAVEMFLKADGTLLVNELAPRPHNSGHWTIEAAATSQFEQQIRAICGHALGDTRTLCPAEMINLIGEDIALYAGYASDPAAHVHLYGKAEARPGRKMGHVTRLSPAS